MPKRACDPLQNELAVAVRLCSSSVEYVGFKLPRKTGAFQPDLYPPCLKPEPAHQFEDWWKGDDKDPMRMEVKPDMSSKDAKDKDDKNAFRERLATVKKGVGAAIT